MSTNAELDRSTSSSSAPELALVLGGGGARAAYQVGCLQYIAQEFPDIRIRILTGVSAGAINIAHLANDQGEFQDSVEELSDLWRKLTTEQVFRVDSSFFVKNLFRWASKLVSGGRMSSLGAKGMVDTSPLRRFLRRQLDTAGGVLRGVEDNVESGRLKAAAVTTTSYSTGRGVTWVQGADIKNWERPNREGRKTALSVEHIMASSSLPIFFPAVYIRGAWYGDGGISQTTPLAPAIHLGANNILAISTRYSPDVDDRKQDVIHPYPPPAQIAGVLLSAIFVDSLEQDADMLRRINSLLEQIPDREHEGLRRVGLCVIRPSIDIAELSKTYEPELPRVFRYMMRGFGSRETERPDWLSMVMFQPEYIRRLLERGRADAEAQHDKIEAFLEQAQAPSPQAQ